MNSRQDYLVYMTISKVIQETTTDQDKLLRMPRKYFGAILGIVVFLTLAMVSGFIKQLQLLSIGLTLPGAIIFIFIILPLKFPSEIVTILHYLFIFGISSIPAGFIGSRLISTNKAVGIRLLVIYLLYLLSVIIIGYIIVGDFYYYVKF